MEEDVGVKVTTRLRRRLSVEQSEDGSSPVPSTPTKKRGGRLAAKPQLELIDENTPVSSPRKPRRKSLATEADEKPITPSRRSARIKSNSSIVSETLSVLATDSPRAKRAARRNSQAGSDNEGPATPARQPRRARKDSTSSVENQESGTVAKPLAVAEMVIEEEPENEVQIVDSISKSSPTPASDELSPNSARKSKRLLEKRSRRSGSQKSDHDCSTFSVEENKSIKVSAANDKVLSKIESQSHSPLNRSDKSEETNEDLSESNMNLLKKLDTESKMNKSKYNKSVSSLDIIQTDTSKRNRTESWPSVRTPVGNDSVHFSDNEVSKKRKDKSDKIKPMITSIVNTNVDTPKIEETDTNEKNTPQSFLDTSSKRKKKNSETLVFNNNDISEMDKTDTYTNEEATCQSFLETSAKRKKNQTKTLINDDAVQIDKMDTSVNEQNISDSLLDTSSKRKKRQSATLFTEDIAKPEDIPEKMVLQEDNFSNKETPSEQSGNTDIVRDITTLFDSAPSKVQATVYFEDSDSNNVGTETANNVIQSDNEDQCVPVVKHDIQENLSTKDSRETNAFPNLAGNDKVSCTDVSIPKVVNDDGNNSCEPMDIDETIHEEILQQSLDISGLSKRERKSVSLSQSATNVDLDKSKRKSSISNTDTSDRSKNENKSTLILSQIKDVSSTIENIKSPTQINEVLLKTDVNVHEDSKSKITKGNLSLNDLKGTPKQTAIQKLTMQTSTPITTQQLDIKTKANEGSLSTKQSKWNFSQKSNNDADSSEDESGSSDDEASRKKSNLLDDEAEEASDNYESGDSQDEEERRYEAEHEILEKGETLTSDEDVSNDTDYEKDSFIVSSDAEDNELLTGSGDDLSMSDKELSMSKKSKKKFNERKEKEQKKASREMFEARHRLNATDEKSPAKIKKNRMRLDSSLLESDEEVVVKPKKNNRMRLDSTIDTCVEQDDTNISQKKSKKKDISMQDSTHDTSFKEDSITDELDKSKKNNKSKREIDEKEITVCNESTPDNTDPLQIHVKQEPKTPQKDLNISVVQFTDRQEIENVHVPVNSSIVNQTEIDPLHTTNACEDSSDIGEDEEIMQNYDSVLNELNKITKTKLNNNNMSLITGKKAKNIRVEPIIDQLNLTHTKKLKKNDKPQEVLDSKPKTEKKQDSGTDDSSSSIDLQLLFSEDNGSEDEQTATQKKDKGHDDDKTFIPLKKSPGKTNIREGIGMNISQKDTPLNESDQKKRKSLLEPPTPTVEQDVNASQLATSLNESSKKKKKLKSSLLLTETIDGQDNYNKSIDVNVSLNESGTKKKKKHSISEATAEEIPDICVKPKDVNASLNESVKKTKKKHSISEPAVEEANLEIANTVESVLAESSSKKKKKKKRKSSLNAQDTESAEGELFFIDTAGTLRDNIEIKAIESKAAVTPKSEKKKKLGQKLEKLVCDDDSDGAPDEAPYHSVKATDADLQNTESEDAETGSGKKSNKKKKKKKTTAASNQSGESIDTENNISSNSKKRKRKSSNAEGSQNSEDVQDNQETGTIVDVAGGHKKKRKISHNEENHTTSGASESNHVKKNKKNPDMYFQDTVSALETTEGQVKKNKKRKHRDEDGDSKQTKVSKENSFQEVHVPRLPDSILDQLDDKPRKTDAAKVVSTTNFIVENARQKRAKPSNYLEESIYLGANSPIAKKEKPRIKKPKVLPFIPTASTSDSGFTTNFKINKLSQVATFEAEPVYFSKETYLQRKKIKKLGTYDRYKKQMHYKMSKF